jgi:hydroxyacylglutathione hydrolase
MKITAIPAFRDNYVWAIHDDHAAILVDPGEAAPILAWLEAGHIIPSALLVTHHHGDHTGGIAAIRARYPVPVYAPASENIPGTTHPLQGGETLAFPGLGVAFTVLSTPGHTRGHLCYLAASPDPGTLFCGDTLFSCGCGRLFEGTPAQMHAALSRLRALPPDTQVCCAHEYTLENLDFALLVEPDNPALHQRLAQVKELREAGTPTLPVSLAMEIATNPFLRFDQAAVVVAASQHAKLPVRPGLAAFTVLRAWRDDY